MYKYRSSDQAAMYRLAGSPRGVTILQSVKRMIYTGTYTVGIWTSGMMNMTGIYNGQMDASGSLSLSLGGWRRGLCCAAYMNRWPPVNQEGMANHQELRPYSKTT